MTVANTTPYAVLGVPYAAPDGREIVLALVKATFVVDEAGVLRLAEEQAPVRLLDVPHDSDAEESSIRYPSDVGGEKMGTDVVLIGDAIARRGATSADVGVDVRGRKVTLRAHGERVYYKGLRGVVIGPAAAFDRKPIVWENAYGGRTDDYAIVERRNPVGRGVARRASDLVDRPAPTIEDPARPITAAGDDHEPAGLGAIATHWLPRAALVGSFDAAWLATRMPLLPMDFHRRYYNLAPASLQFEPHLGPGDVVSVTGMTEARLFRVELPKVGVVVFGKRDDGATLAIRPPIDTVLIEPGERRVQLTMRACLPKGRGKTLLREVRVHDGQVGSPR